MKINPISPLSFKSVPLHNVKVKKKEGSSYREVDAVFSKLDPFDSEDFEAVQKLKKKWGLDTLVVNIAHDFKPVHYQYCKDNFYAIELKGTEPLPERIVSICEVSSGELSPCTISYIQSKPPKKYEKRDLKGGGEVMIYGIIKEFEGDKDCEKIELDSMSSATDFYERIGFKNDNDILLPLKKMKLPKKDFESYKFRIEEKYEIKGEGK